MYYLRTKAAAAAIQFTVDKKKLKEITNKENEAPITSGDVLKSPLKAIFWNCIWLPILDPKT